MILILQAQFVSAQNAWDAHFIPIPALSPPAFSQWPHEEDEFTSLNDLSWFRLLETRNVFLRKSWPKTELNYKPTDTLVTFSFLQLYKFNYTTDLIKYLLKWIVTKKNLVRIRLRIFILLCKLFFFSLLHKHLIISKK